MVRFSGAERMSPKGSIKSTMEIDGTSALAGATLPRGISTGRCEIGLDWSCASDG